MLEENAGSHPDKGNKTSGSGAKTSDVHKSVTQTSKKSNPSQQNNSDSGSVSKIENGLKSEGLIFCVDCGMLLLDTEVMVGRGFSVFSRILPTFARSVSISLSSRNIVPSGNNIMFSCPFCKKNSMLCLFNLKSKNMLIMIIGYV